MVDLITVFISVHEQCTRKVNLFFVTASPTNLCVGPSKLKFKELYQKQERPRDLELYHVPESVELGR